MQPVCSGWPTSARASWPGENLCYSCFYAAMRTRGICPRCGHDGVLPGLAADGDREPICVSCAGIPGDFTCRQCGAEGDFYRRKTCIRCALRDDLTALMIDGARDPQAMAPIVEALCGVERPASILTWKRSPRVQELLTGLASGDIPLTHQGLDEAGTDKATNHLRSLLEHAGILAARDEPLALFELLAFRQTRGGHRAGRARAGGTIRHVASPASVTQDIGSRTKHRCGRAIRQTRDHRGDQVPYLAAQRTSAAPWPAASNKTSMSGWHRVPSRDERSETCLAWAKKPG